MCSRCGLAIEFQDDAYGSVWLSAKPTVAETGGRAVCPDSVGQPVPRSIHHVPLVPSVSTDPEVLLELLATMPPEVIEQLRRVEQWRLGRRGWRSPP